MKTVCFNLYEISRVAKFIETESRMVVARGCGEGKMGNCCLTDTVSILQYTTVLEIVQQCEYT